MRMWLTDPRVMCTKHLLSEHLEIHMLSGQIKKNKSLDGYVTKGLIDLDKLIPRHEEIVDEMKNRGYKHNTWLTIEEREKLYFYSTCGKGKDYKYTVNTLDNEIELTTRCETCRNMSLKKEKKYFNYTTSLTYTYNHSDTFSSLHLSWKTIDKVLDIEQEFAFIDFTRHKYLQDGTGDIIAEYCITYIEIDNRYRNMNFTTTMLNKLVEEISKLDTTAYRKYIFTNGFSRMGEKTVKPLLEKLSVTHPEITYYPEGKY